MKIKNYGLIIDTIQSDHYYLGGGFVGTKVINENGDWTKYLPADEVQNILFETYNCTGFGTNNAIETLLNFTFGIKPNFSDRFTGACAGTREPGNSPHTVAESIRSNGQIDEEELPFSNLNNVNEYFSFKGQDSKRILNLGREWLKNYSFKHEWVFRGGTVAVKNELISQALKRGTVAMSVAAWGTPDANGVYHKEWDDNHWVMCYGETPTAWKIFDSYDNTHKLYSKESNIIMAKLYWITKLTPSDNKSFIDYITWLFNVIFKSPATPMDNIENISPEIPVIPKIEPTKTDLSVALFCLAIQNFEIYALPGETKKGILYPRGSLSYRNCNPGNLKGSVGWKNQIGKDSNGFAIFPNYQLGFNTLKGMVYNACSGQSKVYNPEMTITQFFLKYDLTHPKQYAESVAKELHCGVDLKIKNLILK